MLNGNKKTAFQYYDYFCLAGLFLLSFWVSQHMFISWDVSWHMEAARQILYGTQHGKDIFDDNPPMVFWFFIPIVWFHQVSGISLITLCMISAHCLVAVSFVLCDIYLKEIYIDSPSWKMRVIRYAILIFLLFFSVPDYAQREMLLTAFCLPYIVLMAARMQIDNCLHFNNAYFQVFLGFLMAIGIALNPMFGALVLVLEIQLWVTKKRLVLVRPELVAFVVVFLMYLISIYILFPDYYSKNIPSFFAFSPNADSSFLRVILNPSGFIVFLSILIFFISDVKKVYRSWIWTLFLCAIVSYVIFLLNKKTWYYHLFPSVFFSGVLLTTILCDQLSAIRKSMMSMLIVLYAILFLLFDIGLEYITFDTLHHEYSNAQATLPQLITFFKNAPEHSTVLAFSTRLFPVFPLIDYVPLQFVSYEPCYWELALFVGKNNDKEMMSWRKKWIQTYKEMFLTRVVKVMKIKKPYYVIVDVAKYKAYFNGVKFNYIAYFERNAEFRQLWKKYHWVKNISHYAIYQYKK